MDPVSVKVVALHAADEAGEEKVQRICPEAL
jgi:hypothetical protein